MKYKWVVDVGIRVGSIDEWVVVNERLRVVVSKESVSAGTGGGVRDMQWLFNTKEEAEAACLAVEKEFEERVEYSTAYQDLEEYYK